MPDKARVAGSGTRPEDPDRPGWHCDHHPPPCPVPFSLVYVRRLCICGPGPCPWCSRRRKG